MSGFPEAYEELSGLHKAALLMNVLGPQCSKKIFGQLKDNDIKRLLGVMGSVDKAPVTMVKRVLEDFFFELSEEESLIFGTAKGKHFILETLGEERERIGTWLDEFNRVLGEQQPAQISSSRQRLNAALDELLL